MSVLPVGKRLTRGQYLASGSFRFGLDKTGHLRLTDAGQVIWNASCKYAMPSYVVAQPDGNLVAYSGKRAVFSSGTAHKGGTKLVLQADRNVVVYNGTRAVWTTRTNTKPTSSAPSTTASTLRTDPSWGSQVAQHLGWPAANINTCLIGLASPVAKTLAQTHNFSAARMNTSDKSCNPPYGVLWDAYAKAKNLSWGWTASEITQIMTYKNANEQVGISVWLDSQGYYNFVYASM